MLLLFIRHRAMGLLAGLVAACALGPATADQQSPLVMLDIAAQHEHLAQLHSGLEQLAALSEGSFPLPTRRARITLEAMYSAQQGSWPFEPFVHNGLFRAIADYQSRHPRAVVVSGGRVTLQQLHAELANERIIRRHADGYLLSFPLLIAADGALIVEDTALYLYGHSGTAVINRGALSINRAAVTSVSDARPHLTDRPSRPFIMNWAGSRLRIQSSDISALGYDENLSRGVTAARSLHQGASTAPVQVLVDDSRFTDMTVALEVNGGLVRVTGSQFGQLQQYALDLADTRLLVRDNRVDGVRHRSALRIGGRSQGVVEDNRLLRAGKSAIEIAGLDGDLIISANQLGATEGYGLLLRDASASSRLLIENNLIGNTGLTAIDASGLSQVSIFGNRIYGTPEYAISLRNTAPAAGPLWVADNHLEAIGKAMLRVQGVHRMRLGENHYRANPLLQNLLIGDLLPYQAAMLDMTLRQGGVAALQLERVSLLPGED